MEMSLINIFPNENNTDEYVCTCVQKCETDPQWGTLDQLNMSSFPVTHTSFPVTHTLQTQE